VSGDHAYARVGRYPVQVAVSNRADTVTAASTVLIYAWKAQGLQRTDDPERALLLPAGEAAVDLNPGALRLAQPLDFDRSPGTAVGGSPALAYNSATVDVRPILELDLGGILQTPAAERIDVQLTWGWDTAPLGWVSFHRGDQQ